MCLFVGKKICSELRTKERAGNKYCEEVCQMKFPWQTSFTDR